VTSSVDGLVSGLSTSALISQLMQIEAAPQTRLKSKVTAEQSVLTALQSVNSKFAALETTADAVRSTSTTWQSAKATSSDPAVAASATAGAAAGSLSFDVTRLARNQISTVTVATPATAVTTSNTVSIAIGAGAPVAINVSADKSASGVAAAINAKGIGVKAAVVVNGSGEAVLQLTASKTGTANGFTVAGLDVAPVKTAVAAQDAEITIGDPANGGYTITSDTNSFTNLMAGVTITATKVQSGVTVSVDPDADAIADKMQAFVDAANAALTELNKQGAISVGAKTQAPMAGEYALRKMSQSILSSTGNGLTGFGSFKQVGVELTRDGKLTFNKDAFLTAYKADPAVAKTGATALGDALKTVADDAQKDITSLTQNHSTMIKSLNDQIDNWDVRLVNRQTTLQRQYSNLEVVLGKLKNQSTWLASQLAGLSTGSS
jgi:flagellar hook-associated protein 2